MMRPTISGCFVCFSASRSRFAAQARPPSTTGPDGLFSPPSPPSSTRAELAFVLLLPGSLSNSPRRAGENPTNSSKDRRASLSSFWSRSKSLRTPFARFRNFFSSIRQATASSAESRLNSTPATRTARRPSPMSGVSATHIKSQCLSRGGPPPGGSAMLDVAFSPPEGPGPSEAAAPALALGLCGTRGSKPLRASCSRARSVTVLLRRLPTSSAGSCSNIPTALPQT
mmetsp:Transcript_31768/g.105247  ORF Transcript_31768/g.105247 Transcript_31768/m.105247 type:complete len:227 (-) Transcript_31768:817-1497(-)